MNISPKNPYTRSWLQITQADPLIHAFEKKFQSLQEFNQVNNQEANRKPQNEQKKTQNHGENGNKKLVKMIVRLSEGSKELSAEAQQNLKRLKNLIILAFVEGHWQVQIEQKIGQYLFKVGLTIGQAKLKFTYQEQQSQIVDCLTEQPKQVKKKYMEKINTCKNSQRKRWYQKQKDMMKKIID